ncbi:MAG TPA: site-specific integrase [Syntrophorhabdales bacterium]|nr:site-specific integrase [Syntrophorhabdales bacterium]
MGLYLRGKTWWVSFTANGQAECRSTGTKDRNLAEKVWAKIQVGLVENTWFDVDRSRHYTYEDLRDRFLKEYAPRKEPNTQAMYKRSFKHFDRDFAGRSLASVDSNAISAYMAKRFIDEEAMAATVNREYSTLSKAMSLAVKPWHWMKQNPCWEISKYDEHNIKVMWLDDKQEAMLLEMSEEFMDGNLSDMETAGIHAGFREHEILDLKVFQVNLFNRTVTALETKNHEPRTVPLNDTLYDMLSRRLEGLDGNAYVFSDPDGASYAARRLQKEFKAAVVKANEAGANIVPYFTFHGCRHTFGTRLGQAGKNSRQIGELMGIKSENVLRRYTHFSVESLRGVVVDLERKRAEKKSKKQAVKKSSTTILLQS